MARSSFWFRIFPLLLLAVLVWPLLIDRQASAVVQAGVLEQLPASTDALTHVLSYQGRLADPATGAPKADGSYSMTFRIYDVASAGTALWTEIKDVTVSKGLFSTLLGDTMALPATIFDGNDRWLGVKIGGDVETTPRMRMAFVPYATWSINSGGLEGQNAAFYRNASNINAGTLADGLIAGSITRDSEVLGIVTSSDGAGSGVDADLLDGLNSSSFIGTSGGTMSSSSVNPVLKVTQNGTSPNGGVAGLFSSTESYGVQGETSSGSAGIAGMRGTAGLPGITLANKSGLLGQSDTGWGVSGSSSDSNGVFGWSTNHYAIEGQSPSTGDGGVLGVSFGGVADTSGVYGLHTAGSGVVYGVRGQTSSTGGYGVYGNATATTGAAYGVYGKSISTNNGAAVRGDGEYVGVWATSSGRWGLYATTSGTSNSYGVYGFAPGGSGNYGGYFNGGARVVGNLEVTGSVSKGSGSFKIDHPLDPENKYLYHSFVESPDMMNVYNGNVELDGSGSAWVDLPAYFEALNRDFRYQLTPIGGPGPNLYVAQEVQNNRFQIAGGGPGLRVSQGCSVL